mgnify:CR=1 FL=1
MNWRIDGMKKVFYIVGVSVVVSAVATTAIYLFSCKNKKDCKLTRNYKTSGEERASSDDESSTEATITRDESIYEDVKNSTIGSMYFRHDGAATIMSDSVAKIRENINDSKNTKDEIDEVSDELDKILSED